MQQTSNRSSPFMYGIRENKNVMTLAQTLHTLIHFTLPLVLRDLFCLFVYVLFLLPGFIQMGWFYLTTKSRHVVQYKPGGSVRNYMDIYVNNDNNNSSKDGSTQQTTKQGYASKPVLLFFPGGAFVIGYRMWAALLGHFLGATGHAVVMVADYRNYPFGTVPDMVQDVEDAIQWTMDHCHEYGGDPRKVVVVGQSAGAHLAMVALLKRQQSAASSSSSTAAWKPLDLAGFIGMSGVYDLTEATQTFVQHGMTQHFAETRLFGNRKNKCDPTWILNRLRETDAKLELPPIELWHGTADKTIDYRSSLNFAAKLKEACATNDTKTTVQFQSYKDWNHTDAIIESVMVGNHRFHLDVCRCIEQWCDVKLSFEPQLTTMCPRFLVQTGKPWNPF